MSESYYFALCPRYLKVDHSFAKNIVPGTRYRLAVFKGIQKCDQMKQPMKSKIVGGKMQFASVQLYFHISFYNPQKSIQFSVKLYQQKPNNQEVQIGSYVISSSEYIKLYKSQKKSQFYVSGTLLSGVQVDLDLLVQKSKQQLNERVKRYLDNILIIKGKDTQDDDSKSQRSELSRQFVRNVDGFISPKRRLERKKSPEARSGSRAKSINKSQKSFTNLLPKSPKSSKVQNDNKKQLIDNNQIGIQKGQYQPVNNLAYGNKSKILRVQTERALSPTKSSSSSKQNQMIGTDQGILESKTFKIQVKRSPRSNQTFQIPKVQQSSPIKIISPKRYQLQRQSQIHIKEGEQNGSAFPQIRITTRQDQFPKISITGTKTFNSSLNEPKRNSMNLLSFDSHQSIQQSTIRIVMEDGVVNYPQPQLIDRTSSTITLQIEQKKQQPKITKSFQQSHIDFIKTANWKRSIRSTELKHSQIHQSFNKQKDTLFQQKKTRIFYAIFLIISFYLIYCAMTPTRRA